MTSENLTSWWECDDSENLYLPSAGFHYFPKGKGLRYENVFCNNNKNKYNEFFVIYVSQNIVQFQWKFNPNWKAVIFHFFVQSIGQFQRGKKSHRTFLQNEA